MKNVSYCELVGGRTGHCSGRGGMIRKQSCLCLGGLTISAVLFVVFFLSLSTRPLDFVVVRGGNKSGVAFRRSDDERDSLLVDKYSQYGEEAHAARKNHCCVTVSQRRVQQKNAGVERQCAHKESAETHICLTVKVCSPCLLQIAKWMSWQRPVEHLFHNLYGTLINGSHHREHNDEADPVCVWVKH